MKPIPSLVNALNSVNLKTKESAKAEAVRSDVCAVPAAGVIAEASVAIELAKALAEKFGEKEFRQMESEIIRNLLQQERPSVISCRGGAVLNPSNIKLLGNKGIIINLYASPEVIYDRIKSDSTRPLLKRENPLDEIKRLLELRKEVYSDCDYAFNTDGLTPRQVVNNILKSLDHY
jgi:shikimate kinase